MRKNILTILCAGFVSFAQADTPPYMKLGYSIYVGGLHIGNIETDLFINADNTYTFNGYARTAGFTDFIARLLAVSTSSGDITTDGFYKWNRHTNTSTARFGDNYSVLIRQADGKTQLTRYPDRNEVNLENLENNPLSIANDPMATFLNMMVQIGKDSTCSQDVIIVANHFLYRMNTVKSYSMPIEKTDYNVASGDMLACDLKFTRLDKEKNLSAYKKMDGSGDGQAKPPTIFFKQLGNIPYALPVLVQAKERRFGAFRMHLQYVQYAGNTIQSKKWDTDLTLTEQQLQILQNTQETLSQ